MSNSTASCHSQWLKMRTKREPLTINNNVFRSLAIYRSEVVEDKVSVSGNSFPVEF